MVVHHIEDHAEAEFVGAIDQKAEVIRRSVKPGGGEKIHPIVTPAEAPGKIGHGHDFEQGHAKFAQRRQLVRRGAKGAARGKSADVHLVDHLTFAAYAFPVFVGPGKGGRIDHLGGAVRTFRLPARSRIGPPLAFTELVAVEIASFSSGIDPTEIAITLRLKRDGANPRAIWPNE